MDGAIVDLKLRTPCVCGSPDGYYRRTNGQCVVRCTKCNKFSHNAPKTETGLKQRSLQTTHDAVSGKLRSKVIERCNARCERCGRPAHESENGLQVGHVVSVKDGHKIGLSDAEINSMENRIGECTQCNLGHGKDTLPLRLMVAILHARARRNGDEVSF